MSLQLKSEESEETESEELAGRQVQQGALRDVLDSAGPGQLAERPAGEVELPHPRAGR